GTSRPDYAIQLPAGKTLRQSDDGSLVTGPDIPRRCSLAEPALVDTMHVELGDSSVRFGPRDRSEYVALRLGDTGKPSPDATFVTWSADPDAPYYCVEPWMGPPNAPGHGRGL